MLGETAASALCAQRDLSQQTTARLCVRRDQAVYLPQGRSYSQTGRCSCTVKREWLALLDGREAQYSPVLRRGERSSEPSFHSVIIIIDCGRVGDTSTSKRAVPALARRCCWCLTRTRLAIRAGTRLSLLFRSRSSFGFSSLVRGRYKREREQVCESLLLQQRPSHRCVPQERVFAVQVYLCAFCPFFTIA